MCMPRTYTIFLSSQYLLVFNWLCIQFHFIWHVYIIVFQPLENLRLIMAWFLATSVWLYNSIAVGLAQGTSYFDEGKLNDDFFLCFCLIMSMSTSSSHIIAVWLHSKLVMGEIFTELQLYTVLQTHWQDIGVT